MRALIQRVDRASVRVGGEVVGSISRGLLVFVGVGKEDDEAAADSLAAKIAGLRLFNDDQEKMNLSVADIGGSLLIVSQFTLYGDVRRGRRPAFDRAAPPDRARLLYERFVSAAKATGVPVETGIFQASMEVELTNLGPVTILVDTEVAKGL
ncbi:MAG: D-aminoacyl-tRNA deacylase [Bryobacteraceae bacterium]